MDVIYNIDEKCPMEALREIPLEELVALKSAARQARLDLESQGAGGQMKHLGIMPQPHLFRKVRQDIARMETAIKEKTR